MSMEIQLSRGRTQGHKDRSIKIIWSDENKKKKESKIWGFIKYFEMNQCDVLSTWQTLGSLGRWASGHAGWRLPWLSPWVALFPAGILDWVKKGSWAVLPDWGCHVTTCFSLPPEPPHQQGLSPWILSQNKAVWVAFVKEFHDNGMKRNRYTDQWVSCETHTRGRETEHVQNKQTKQNLLKPVPENSPSPGEIKRLIIKRLHRDLLFFSF